ncbi:MAG: hypothetical protein PVF54_08360 [Anaerolineae bacterium]
MEVVQGREGSFRTRHLQSVIRVAREAQPLAIVTLCVLVASSVPVVYGYLSTPSDKWFSGVVYNVHDTAQYFSWMRQSADSVLIENRLTSEPTRAVFFNLHWWIPGRLAAAANLSLPQVYQIFRLLSIPLATTSLFLFCARVFEEPKKRRFSFVLATLTSGLGWIWVVKKYLLQQPDVQFPRDVYTLPGNSFWVMTASPHLTFALAVTLLTLLLALEGYRRKHWIWSVGAGTTGLFLGMGHIYDLVTVWAVLGVFGLLVTLRDGWSWDTLWRLAAVILISVPAPLYWGWVASDANPTWKQALSQYDNLGVFTPNPLHMLILLGLTFILCLATFDRVVPLRRQPDELLFIKGWFGITLLLVYLPFRFRITLLTGYQLPIAVLATIGFLDRVLPWLRRNATNITLPGFLAQREWVEWTPHLFLLAVAATNLYLLAWRVVVLRRYDYPYYLHQDDLAALRWLEENTNPDDVVLSSFTIGHYIPGLAGNRPFLSNAVMTMDSHDKEKMMEAFFDRDTSDAERDVLLRRYGIRYLFHGLAERALGAFEPAQSGLFEKVYARPQTQVYALRHESHRIGESSSETECSY